jgi:hypothetical protein
MSKITFEIDGQEYKIPQLITIGDFMKISKFSDLIEEDFFITKIISILTGCDEKKLLKLNREEMLLLFQELHKILPSNNHTFIQSFILDDVEYGFIPHWKKMSFGEFADLDTLMSRKKGDMIDFYHIITAILYRPITKKKKNGEYQIEDYDVLKMEERAELFKNKLSVDYFLSGQFFFTQFVKNVTNYTPISLKLWMKISWLELKIAWKMRKTLWRMIFKKDLDGTLFLTEFHKTILQNMSTLQNKQL